MQAEALAAVATAELAATEVVRWRTSAERAHVAMREGVERSETATEVRAPSHVALSMPLLQA